MRRIAKNHRPHWVVVVLTIGCLALIVGGFRWLTPPQLDPLPANSPPADQSALEDSAEPPPVPIRPTRFLNAAADASYVGSEVCAGCHASEHASYLLTAHSRALGNIDLATEPPDGQFTHAKTGRQYRVARSGDRLWHRETLVGKQGQELVSVEHSVRHVIGSGHHSRSYLVELDGFLVESPLTWYATNASWGLSPGYDRPQHDSFERVADHGCVTCHVGNASMMDGNRYRLKILEGTIGCESCHGPGSLHVAKQRVPAPVAAGEDLTIVQPVHLGRDQREAICARCHMRGAASVLLRGRQLDDFRPGQRLEDFRIDFVSTMTSEMMKVVGHVEQMRASRCFQKSDSLTCTTCHDPHTAPTSDQRIRFFRDKCNECHHEHCGLPPAQRLAADRHDNCVGCHMPQRPTNLPHFAFTHHRIGVHSTAGADPSPGRDDVELVPLSDVSHLSPLDRQRGLGLAYFEYADHQVTAEGRRECLRRAELLLTSAAKGGLRDADVLAALAVLAWHRDDLPQAERFATEAAAKHAPGSHAPANARLVLADIEMRRGDRAAAEQSFAQLVQLRRSSDDWVLLGRLRETAGDLSGAIEAFRRAAAIHPFRSEVYRLLSVNCTRLGDADAARKYQEIAEALSENEPAPRRDR